MRVCAELVQLEPDSRTLGTTPGQAPTSCCTLRVALTARSRRAWLQHQVGQRDWSGGSGRFASVLLHPLCLLSTSSCCAPAPVTAPQPRSSDRVQTLASGTPLLPVPSLGQSEASAETLLMPLSLIHLVRRPPRVPRRAGVGELSEALRVKPRPPGAQRRTSLGSLRAGGRTGPAPLPGCLRRSLPAVPAPRPGGRHGTT